MIRAANAFRNLFRRTAAAERVAAAVRGRVRMQVEEIEPRILYSADLAPGLVSDNGTPSVQMRLVTPSVPTTQQADAQETRRHELVVVDASTQDYQQLVDDIVANAGPERRFDVLLIDASRDGIADITAALAGMQEVDAVHLISHGSAGVVHLGAAVLDARSLDARSVEIARWAASLTEHADLLIYGCDVAGSAEGQAFASALATLTGADVAASEDPTGSAARGGDWQLEFTAGAIESGVATSTLVQAQWQGLLATDVVLHQYNPTLGVLDPSELKSDQSWAQTFRHDSPGATYEVDKVAIVLSRASDAPAGQTITVSLRSTFGGAVIASGTVSSNALSTSPAWVTIVLTSGATLNDNQSYVLRVDGSNEKIYVGTDGSGSYGTGDLLDKSGAIQSGKDMAFRLLDTAPTAAPVLNGANNLTGINEDPAANSGTLVSALVAGQVTLDPLLATSGIAVTAVDDSNGLWQYTTDGTTWNAFGAVSASAARLLAADTNNAVRFVPNSNWNGTVANGITFRAWDQTSGADGGVASTGNDARTVRDEFSAVSYTNNNGSANWSAGWTDTDGNAGAGQIRVSGNALSFNGALLSSSSIHRQADLTGATSATLSFDFVNAIGLSSITLEVSDDGGANYDVLASSFANGSGTASFDIGAYIASNTRIRFTVSGLLGGGTFSADNIQIAYTVPLNGGNSAFSTATASSSVTVSPVNDAPVGANKTVVTLEDTPYTFIPADFAFSDTADSPANNFTAVQIVTLPATGALTLSGAAVTAGATVSLADITAGNLRYAPAADANGAAAGSFTFKVQDDGGTANGGVNLDAVARTMTIDVTPVNDAPVGSGATITAVEDAAYTFLVSDFGLTDPKDAAPNNLAAVEITTLPATGSLTLNGGAVGATQLISAADIAAGNLRFTPAANANGAANASFTFKVQDDGGTANGGVNLDTTARTLTIDVTAVNDAPVLAGSNNLLLTLEDALIDPGTLVSALLGGQVSDADAGAISGIAVTAVDNTNGRWQYTTNSGGAWSDFGTPTAGDARLLAADANTFVRFVPDANWNGTVTNGITFRAWDQTSGSAGGTADTSTNGGATGFSTATASSSINVVSINDAPAGTDATLAAVEDTAFVFTAASFGFSDASDSPANALAAVRIASLPAAGALTLSGIAVTAGQSITLADITAGNLRFDAGSDATGAGFASFTFQVRDDGGTANGGVDLDASPNTITIDVTAVNDAPAASDNTITVAEDASFTFTAAAFGFTDPDDSPANALAGVRITTIPAGGELRLSGVAVTAGQVVDAADIAAGNLVYVPVADANGAGYGSFTFQVQDDGGTANGGTDLDPVARTMTIDVTAVNDAPVAVGANNLSTILEDAATNTGTLVSALLAGQATDADGVAPFGIAVTGVSNTNGTWQYSTNGGALWTSFGNPQPGTARLLAADANTFVRFVPSLANWHGTVSNGLTFRVWDGTTGTAGAAAPTIPNPTVRDNFGSVSYSNNDGTASWNAAWVETDGDPNGGQIRISGNELELRSPGGNSTFILRQANLSGATGATLSFTYDNQMDGNDSGTVFVQVSSNGGGSYTTVGTLSNSVRTGTGTFTANITAHISATTQIRFLVGADVGDLTVDNVEIAYTTPGNGGTSAFSTAEVSAGISVLSVNDAPAGANAAVTTLEDSAFTFTAAHFALTDASDSPANALAGVRIAALPTSGALTVSGAAITAGDIVSVADITAGNFRFTPAANANGASSASFTFQVQDDGGTANGGVDRDQSANTITINVTAVNDAPVGTGATVTMFENAALTLSAATFGFTDPNDSPANAFTTVRIASLPTAGTLTLSGAAVTAGQTVTIANINSGNLVFRPAADANGAGYASLTFQVQDNGGTANGGVNLDPVARTLTIDVTPVNSAPSGATSTVTTLEDTGLIFSTADFGFTDGGDAPSNSLASVRIVALPTAGTLRLSGAAVSAGQSITAASIAAGNLVYTPAANANGAASASFTFRVQDDGGTANGGVDLDPVARTMTIDVTAVNDAPAGSNRTVTTLEDTPLVFTLASFSLTDAADTPANALAGVRIASLPASGSLTLNGAAVNAGDVVAAADIGAGLLVFTPATNANGAGQASFTFQVQDDGGTANGGLNLDPVARSMTIDVTAVNDAPAGTDGTVAGFENAPLVLTTASFGFTDPTDAAANTLTAVRITSLPTAGILRLAGAAVTAGQTVSLSDITAGNLVFTPAPHANGNGYATLTFQVQDSGGTANGGVDLDPSANTLTIDLAAVNSAPRGADNTVTALEESPLTFTAASFGFTDADDATPNAFSAVTISSLPASGSLSLGGASVTAGQSITVADIVAGNLRFVGGANGAGTGYASFTFRVQDDGGTANGGIDLDTVARTMTIDVTNVNDAPSGADRTVATLEDTAFTFNAAAFGYADAADAVANNFAGVRIAALPGAGALALNGVALNVGDFVAAADIAAGGLVFTPGANAVGAAYASFTFQVQDDGGTANGGIDLDPVARTITIDVTSVNDAPSGTSANIAAVENTPFVFTAAAFGFADATDVPANNLSAVTVSSLPAVGTLTLSGAAVTAGQSIGVADIAAGNLVFTPDANANGAGYASFTFQVQDDGGTANGGVDIDPVARMLTIDVAAANSPPVGTSNTIVTLEDTGRALTAADFGFTDPSDTPANALAAVIVSSLPTAGTLALSGVAITAGQSVALADIVAGNLVYTPGADGNGAAYATFTFRVQDDGGTANGGVDLDIAARTMTIDVTPVNDAPIAADRTIATLEDVPLVFNAAAFGLTDPVDAGAHALASVTIFALPTAGSLTLAGTAVTAGQTVAAADIAAGNLVFTPGAHETGAAYASFTFQVQDDGGVANGGVDLDPVIRTMTVDVTAVNDAPVGTDVTRVMFENAQLVLDRGAFGFTDPVDGPANGFTAVTVASLPATGTLTLNGAAVAAGQSIAVADIDAGRLVFTPVADANGLAYSSFTFRVQDDGGTANGGIDLDAMARTLTIDVTPTNSAPVGTNGTVVALEDTAFALDVTVFGFTDPADAVVNNFSAVTIATLPALGTLTLSGVAVTAGQSIAVADIAAGNLVYVPGANGEGAGYASFTFRVQDDGGTANGGVDLDVVARTLTIDVTNVNDAPSGTANTVVAIEDVPFTLNAAAFGLTDSADAIANNLAAILISSVPTAGTLTLNGVVVNAGDMASIAEINGGNLVFTPGANGHGAGYASFTFQVRDDGGVANGGVDLDPVARTLTIDVLSVNDAPTGANTTVTALEDTPFTFALSDFGFSDARDAPSNSIAGITIDTLGGAGTLRLNGVAVTAGQIVNAADIAAGRLVFSPGTNANGAGYASFTFRVQDDGGTANGGIAVDPVAKTMTIDVTSINDAPRGFGRTVTLLEDTPYAFQTGDFVVADPSDNPANALFAVRVASLPTAGSLTVNGAAVAVGDFVSAADIAAGNFTFTPVLNAFGTNHARFTFQVQDDGGTANGGLNLDATARTMQMNVTRVSDAPVGTSGAVTAVEDTVFTFSAAAFGFSDPADTPSHVFQAVHVTSLPALGTLTLNGVAVSAGDVISVADIDAGAFRFAAAPDGAGAAYARFEFRVQDSGGTADGGLDVDTTARTMTINVTPVNDRPAGTNATVRTAEDTPLTLTAAMFGFTDPRDIPADSLKAIRIAALPTQGSLALGGVTVTLGQTIDVADIAAGRLVFTAPADVAGQPFATFRFEVQDDGGTANGGLDRDVTANTLTVVVDAVNDAPIGRDGTLSTLVNVPVTIDTGAFGFSDPIDPVADAFIAVQVVTIPSTGTLTFGGLTVLPGQFISTADIAAGRLTYVPSQDAVGTASFTFKVQDSGGTADGGKDVALVARTLTVDVRAPVVTAVEVQAPVANATPTTETRNTTAAPASSAGSDSAAQAARETTATVSPTVPTEPEVPVAVGATSDTAGVASRSVQVTVQRIEFQPPNRETRALTTTSLGSEVQSLTLLSDRTDSQTDSSSVVSLTQTRAAQADIAPAAAARQLTEQMDQMRDGLRHETRIESGTIAATAATSLGLSVGYVIWVLRGGVLLSTLVSSLPAWRLVDPLPVLGRMDGDDDEEGDDSLESLVDSESDADADGPDAADKAEGARA